MRAIILLGLSFFSGLSVAAPAWTQAKPLTDMLINPSFESVFVKMDTMIDPMTCQYSDWYELRSDNKMYKEIYSLLLAAYMSQKPVKLYLGACSASGHIRIDEVRITQ